MSRRHRRVQRGGETKEDEGPFRPKFYGGSAGKSDQAIQGFDSSQESFAPRECVRLTPGAVSKSSNQKWLLQDPPNIIKQ